MIGEAIWNKYKQVAGLLQVLRQHGPDPPPHAPDGRAGRAASARKASPRATTSRRSSTTTATTSPTPSWASSPAPPRTRSADCLEDWNKGDNGILDLSKAYRLKPGTGWLIPPGVLHAPGSLCTYEPQWGSTSSACTSRSSKAATSPGRCSSRTCPRTSTTTSTIIVEQLDWDKNVDPNFKDNHYLEPIVHAGGDGRGLRRQVDRLRQGRRRAALHRQGTDRRARRRRHDQGQRRLRPDRRPRRRHDRQARRRQPELIRFGELTEDEVFVTESGAKAGVTFENTGTEPLVSLRYFGPDVHPNAPEVGDHLTAVVGR